MLAIGKKCVLDGFDLHCRPLADTPDLVKPDGIEFRGVYCTSEYIPLIRNTGGDHASASQQCPQQPAVKLYAIVYGGLFT